jgi:hypothetical protein
MDLNQNNVYVQKLIVISILIYYFENIDLKVIAVFTQEGQKNYKIHKQKNKTVYYFLNKSIISRTNF